MIFKFMYSNVSWLTVFFLGQDIFLYSNMDCSVLFIQEYIYLELVKLALKNLLKYYLNFFRTVIFV